MICYTFYSIFFHLAGRWLRDNFKIGPPIEAKDDVIRQYSRAYILTLFRNVLSIDQSRDGTQFLYIPLITYTLSQAIISLQLHIANYAMPVELQLIRSLGRWYSYWHELESMSMRINFISQYIFTQIICITFLTHSLGLYPCGQTQKVEIMTSSCYVRTWSTFRSRTLRAHTSYLDRLYCALEYEFESRKTICVSEAEFLSRKTMF